ncbi:Topless-related protein 1 [Platanthera zijinensis]|uniref:Topless-related protein 1 n=1 Tax=Platanthera zijinensis TaxID=2320716 RepID=A0AAP0FV06_9ASPA
MSSSEFPHPARAGGASTMPSEEDKGRFRKELMYLIIQFLKEEKFEETVHMLEQESALYFDMKHFVKMVVAGNWDELERYLLGFSRLEDNEQSMKIFFLIRRQKYLEALERAQENDRDESSVPWQTAVPQHCKVQIEGTDFPKVKFLFE